MDTDPMTDIFLSDLDGSGSDEIYIITAFAGSGGCVTVLGFALNID
jgi:hypothetical protein